MSERSRVEDLISHVVWNGSCRTCGVGVHVVNVEGDHIIDHIGEHCREFKLLEPWEYLRFLRCGRVERPLIPLGGDGEHA